MINDVPAYHKYVTAEKALQKHGFEHKGGNPIDGVRFLSKTHTAIVKLNAPHRYEVYVYTRRIWAP